MLLPILSIILIRLWQSAYMTKSLLLPSLQEDFIQAARGRGLSERRIVYGHALRSASPGLSTMSVLVFVSSFGGDILLEKVLAWPGLGKLLWDATSAFNPDIFLISGISTVLALIYCISIVLLDIVYLCLDPRIRY